MYMQEVVTATANGIVTFGAGIVALALILVGVVWSALKFPPLLKSLNDQVILSNKIIETNSQFIQEMSKSNENVAQALKMLGPMFDRTLHLLEEHDAKAEAGWAEVQRIGERTQACRRANP